MERDWALCVGVASYATGSSLVALPGALNDANEMYAWLVRPDGGAVPRKQAEKIVSPSVQPADGSIQPAKEAVEAFFRRIHKLGVKSRTDGNGFRVGRRLWLFYAGHGMLFPSLSGKNEDADTALLMADASPPDDLPHVAGHAWARVFRDTRGFEEVVLLMDCCRTRAYDVRLTEPYLSATPDSGGAAKLMAAFAVAEDESAYEVTHQGTKRGKFSVELMKLLARPRLQPMTARTFLENLEMSYAAVSPAGQGSLAANFELLPVSPGPVLESVEVPNLLIAHGETSADLAGLLARGLEGEARSPMVRMARDVIQPNAGEFGAIAELVITRNVDEAELRDLVERVKPQRTVLLASRDPGVKDLPFVRFVQRPEGRVLDLDIDAVARGVEAALSPAFGTFAAHATEDVAQVRVWNKRGHLVGIGHGSVTLEQAPTGDYLVRATLGSKYTETTASVKADGSTVITLSPLGIALPGPEAVAQLEQLAEPALGTRVVAFRMGDGRRFAMSVPAVAGWRSEVFVHPPDSYVSLSVRMVPEDHPAGAPHPGDAVREWLHWAMASPVGAAEGVGEALVSGDPIATLLNAVLRTRCGLPVDMQAGEALLGRDNPDVALLRRIAAASSPPVDRALTVSRPPLLSFPWHSAIRKGYVTIEANTVADGLVGRLRGTYPWLTWAADEPVGGREWLSEVAHAAWPGWDVLPDAEMAAVDMRNASTRLGSTVESVQRRTYKAPPVDRLVQHETLAFLGGNNEQLAAALAVAFMERGKRKWKRIEVWSLNDEPLAEMISAGRTGEPLLRARKLAEERVAALLPVVAEDAIQYRYDGLHIDGVRTFASLFDWEAPGGFVHASPWTKGQDVRYTPATNEKWVDQDPPHRYAEVVRELAALKKRMFSRPRA